MNSFERPIMFPPDWNASSNPVATGEVIFDIVGPGADGAHDQFVTLRDNDTGVVLGRRALEGESAGNLSPLLQQSLFERVGGVYRLESVRLDMRTAALAKHAAAIASRARRRRRRRAIALPKKTSLPYCEAPSIAPGRENSPPSRPQSARIIGETNAESISGARATDVSLAAAIVGRPRLRLIHCDGPRTKAETQCGPQLRLLPETGSGESVSDAMANSIQATIARIMAEEN